MMCRHSNGAGRLAVRCRASAARTDRLSCSVSVPVLRRYDVAEDRRGCNPDAGAHSTPVEGGSACAREVLLPSRWASMRPRAQLPIFRSPNFNGLFNSCLTAPVACRYLRLQLINPDKHATYIHDEHPTEIVKNRRCMAASTHRARHHTITGLVEPAGLAVVATIPLGVNRSSLTWLSQVSVTSVARPVRNMPGEFLSMALRGGGSLNYQWRHCV